MKPLIAITVGDYNGIGPEITLRSIRHPSILRLCTPVLVGPADVFEYYAKKMHLPFRCDKIAGIDAAPLRPNATLLLPGSTDAPSRIEPGMLSETAGLASVQAIEKAVGIALTGKVQAVVTAPVSKQAMHMAGARYPGQTEMLQHLTGSPRVAMMLVSPRLRVGLVTIHLPLKDVSASLTREIVRERIEVIHEALVVDWKIRKPVMAVLGLNPHAGEGGHLGAEEGAIIVPVVTELRKRGMTLLGPFPADGFFARYRPGVFDAVVAMYHDQGLIPLKMSAGGSAVNVSAGLPIVRTSPDHGTGFDIAGRGKADPGSMIEAIRLAALIAKHRLTPPRRRA